MKKVGIITFWGNNNPGTFLQCLATQEILSELGYDGYLICRKESFYVRILQRIMRECIYRARLLKYIKESKEIIQRRKVAKASGKRSGVSTNKFDECFNKNIKSIFIGNKELKKLAESDEFIAFLSGSDQIWNPSSLNIDSTYFLQFAPNKKRIAFAPSFGTSEVPPYNKEIIKKYISEYNSLSVRETSGAEIIRKMTGLDVPVILDPVLHLSREKWREITHNSYASKLKQKNFILLYFLDAPSDMVLRVIKAINSISFYELIVFQYDYEVLKDYGKYKIINGDPIDFVGLIDNAHMVLTDSFHAAAFSVLMNSNFFVYERQYGHSFSQRGRMDSFLEIVELKNRFIVSEEDCRRAITTANESVDFSYSDDILQNESNKAISYLRNALEEVEYGGTASGLYK